MIIKFKARLAFPALFEAKTVNGEGAPAFSGAFIVPKSDKVTLKLINDAIDSVAKEKWGPKAEAILKAARAADKVFLHDGDAKAEYDGFTGNMYVSARNKSRPLVVDKDRTPLTSVDGKPYAGCNVIVSIEAWAQDNNYGKRVNASLRGVQFHSDGDAFAGGGAATEDEFDDLADQGEEESLV